MKIRRVHRAILAMTLVPGVGNRRIRILLERFPDPARIFSATSESLEQVPGIGSATAEAINSFNRWRLVDTTLERTAAGGMGLITLPESRYPALLRETPDAPAALWIMGNLDALSQQAVAVVGTRRPDRYGRNQAKQWTGELVNAGLPVVSGLAIGVDAIAHAEVVAQGGRAVAVMGSGLDRIYPAENRELAASILESGGLLCSEYPPGTEARAEHFPARNRIVSGLSRGVLVVQSGIRGGSMITARNALDQGREVFVVPHGLERSAGGGNHELIRSGQGKLIERLQDILDEIPDWSVRTDHHHPAAGSEQPASSAGPIPEELRRICRLLADGECGLDRLCSDTGYPAGALLAHLMELELHGLVEQRPGQVFALLRR